MPLLAPFRGTALHYAVAYLDAVMLGAARDMLDRQVHVLCRGCEDCRGTRASVRSVEERELTPGCLQKPDVAAARDATSRSPFVMTVEQIATLEENGWLVVDGVLNSEQVQRARREADELEFFRTGQHGDAVRTDEVRWIRDDDAQSGPGALPPGLAVAAGR